MKTLLQFFTILRKDLAVEFRTRDVLYVMALFAFLLVVLFSFAFLPDPERAREYGPGIVWVTVLFSSTVGLNRLCDRERENGSLWPLLLAPVPGWTVFAAKATAHLVLTSIIEVLTLPTVFVFFDIRLADASTFVLSVGLGTLAIGLVGTLFSTMLMNARFKEVLLPLVIYPLLVPAVVAGVKSTAIAMGAEQAEDPEQWLRFLAGFDMVFCALTFLLFERMARA